MLYICQIKFQVQGEKQREGKGKGKEGGRRRERGGGGEKKKKEEKVRDTSRGENRGARDEQNITVIIR